MNICEATKAARCANAWIRRPWGDDSALYVKPTDTGDGCLVFVRNKETPAKRWQPHAEDLIAEDWEVVTDGQDEIIVHLQGISMGELKGILRRLRRQQGVSYCAHYRERKDERSIRSHDYEPR